MPDKDGYRTLRDKFPIYCSVCTLKIEPPKYHNGECIQDGEKYMILGYELDANKIPTNIYVHQSCL